MVMTPQRKAEIDAMLQRPATTQTTGGMTPERRAQIDAMLAGTSPTPTQPAQTQPGGFQRFVQGVAKPFVNVATNVANFAEGTANLAGAGIASLSGNKERSQELQNKANEAAFKQRDFGYLGKGSAVGGDVPTASAGADFLKGAKQIIGTGTEIASYAAPTALGTGAKAVAAGGKVAPTLGALAKGGAVAGALGSTGAALQENRSAGQVLGAGLTGAALGTGLSLVAPLAGKAAGKVGQKLGKGARAQGIVDNNYRALTQLEDSNAALRKVVAKNKERGIDPKRLLAESDYLVGAVDDTGTLRTMQDGGAVSKARDFIKPMEDVVTSNLQREGKTISLEDVRQQMINNVNASNIKGGDKVGALRKIESEISGLALEADANGNVPLSLVHDAKRYKYANIDYLNPGSKNTDKIIARTLKDIVEKSTDSVDVKRLNDELSGYYSMLSFLEKLDGKKVRGGKLGKYFAQTIGAMVGSSVGGPVGTVVGAELGGRLRGSMMKSTFSKASGKAPKASALLEDAIKLGKTPPEPPKPLLGLPLPDPTKSGPTIPMRGPTTYEPRAKVVGSANPAGVANVEGKAVQGRGIMDSLRGLDSLDADIEKRIEAFRREAGLMADKEGAGVRLRAVKDANDNTDFMAKDFSLNRAKGSMKRQADAGKDYAKEMLYENDPTFKSIVDRRDALLAKKVEQTTSPDDLDVLFGTVDKDIKDAEKAIYGNAEKPGTSRALEGAKKPDSKETISVAGEKYRGEEVVNIKLGGLGGKEMHVPVVENYKGQQIVDVDGEIAVWDKKSETLFFVGLDDSKTTGDRVFVDEANNAQAARDYIDWESGAKERHKKWAVGQKESATDVTATVVDTKNVMKKLRGTKKPAKAATAAPGDEALVAEAKKYKTAEEFVKAQGTPVYHGTGVQFDDFDDSMRGSVTGAKSAKGAIWFTDDPATAKAYSIYAAEEGPVKRALEEASELERIAQRSRKKEDWAKHDAKIVESEELADYDASDERRKQANVKEVVIGGDLYEVDAGGKTPQELSDDDNIDSWLDSILQKAQKLGKDGVKITNLDDAVGLYDRPATHYALFDAKNIKLKSKLTDIWNKANKN